MRPVLKRNVFASLCFVLMTAFALNPPVAAKEIATRPANSALHEGVIRTRIYENDNRAGLKGSQYGLFDSIGSIQCDPGNGKLSSSTAFIIGNNRTIVSTAHAYMDPDTAKLISVPITASSSFSVVTAS
jgi:V8-like Glu-specific endopeptidase